MSPILTGVIASGISGNLTPPWSPEGAYDALATVTVPSGGAANITFAGIPTGYKHLQIRSLTRSSEAATIGGIYMQMNNDTASNYSWHRLFGDGSSAQAGAASTTTWILCGIAPSTNWSGTSNMFSANILDVLDYSSVVKNKTVRALTGVDVNGGGNIALHSGAWYNTSTAVTSITFSPFNGSWQQYSQFALYGVK